MKTTENDASVEAFIDAVPAGTRRDDARTLCDMMARISGHPPRMWGPSIVGFGHYDYRYESGRSGTFMRVGFSPRKSSLSVYIMPGFSESDELMQRLGKHKTGKSCLYINKLADVDLQVLEQLIHASLEEMTRRYGPD